MVQYLKSDELAQKYRTKAVDIPNQKVLITDFRNTAQEEDLTVPPNCGGFGRLRHFVRSRDSEWPTNPLPIDPACRALHLPPQDRIRAQVFQNAVCNWRCWYCFVPFSLLDANRAHSQMMSVGALIDLWSAEPERAQMWGAYSCLLFNLKGAAVTTARHDESAHASLRIAR